MSEQGIAVESTTVVEDRGFLSPLIRLVAYVAKRRLWWPGALVCALSFGTSLANAFWLRRALETSMPQLPSYGLWTIGSLVTALDLPIWVLSIWLAAKVLGNPEKRAFVPMFSVIALSQLPGTIVSLIQVWVRWDQSPLAMPNLSLMLPGLALTIILGAVFLIATKTVLEVSYRRTLGVILAAGLIKTVIAAFPGGAGLFVYPLV
jgi:hypothetical protein